MGTVIDLKVGPVMLDWSKNSRGQDHGALFQEVDRTFLRLEATAEIGSELHEIDSDVSDRAFQRTLKSALPRLELMGFTVSTLQAEYENLLAEGDEYYEDELLKPVPLPFNEFIEFLARHPINLLDETFIQGFDEASMGKIRGRFDADPALAHIPTIEGSGDGYSEASFFGSLLRILNPYSAMRALALVPENLGEEVAWHYGPLVDSGWTEEDAFAPFARREQTFLIATEGSSDVHILKHAISLLMPETEDFFRFIDVSDRHPFSGTGSLVKFAEGLVKIDVQNQILFLFDNDAEGWSAFDELERYTLPLNMRKMVLPDLEGFRKFAALGPQGVLEGDINRRAAAIECYLDLRLEGLSPPRVVWTNYKEKQSIYQGSLEYKGTYMRAFLVQTPESIASGTYDVAKLRVVLDHIFLECCSIAAQRQLTA